jgi:hypothetical protein
MQFSIENKGVVINGAPQLKCPLSASDQIEDQAGRLRYRTNGSRHRDSVKVVGWRTDALDRLSRRSSPLARCSVARAFGDDPSVSSARLVLCGVNPWSDPKKSKCQHREG